MEPSNPWGQILSQLTAQLQPCTDNQRTRFNPHPRGILQAGSETQAVNAFLESNRVFSSSRRASWSRGTLI